MIKVVPYIETMGTNEYKKLLNTPFNFNDIPIYFNNWKGKKMGAWWKFNDNNTTLEFFSSYYNVINKNMDNVIQLPLPKTLNDFINDMNRLDIELYWSNWMEENYDPKHFISKDKIKEYYKKLLSDIEKDHELSNELKNDE